MRSFRSVWLLLQGTFACLAMASCAPIDTQTPRVSPAKTQLTKEQILNITDTVARERGWLPQERRTYDEGNVTWRRCWNGRTLRGLEGRDYQVVWYGRVRAILGGDLAVVVDRDTGVVLKVIEWPWGYRGQPVRHEGVEDQRMRDPSGEFSVHPGSHPSGAAG